MWNIFRIWNGISTPDFGNYATARYRRRTRRVQIDADDPGGGG
jgi:hypothetical protein